MDDIIYKKETLQTNLRVEVLGGRLWIGDSLEVTQGDNHAHFGYICRRDVPKLIEALRRWHSDGSRPSAAVNKWRNKT